MTVTSCSRTAGPTPVHRGRSAARRDRRRTIPPSARIATPGRRARVPVPAAGSLQDRSSRAASSYRCRCAFGRRRWRGRRIGNHHALHQRLQFAAARPRSLPRRRCARAARGRAPAREFVVAGRAARALEPMRQRGQFVRNRARPSASLDAPAACPASAARTCAPRAAGAGDRPGAKRPARFDAGAASCTTAPRSPAPQSGRLAATAPLSTRRPPEQRPASASRRSMSTGLVR